MAMDHGYFIWLSPASPGFEDRVNRPIPYFLVIVPFQITSIIAVSPLTLKALNDCPWTNAFKMRVCIHPFSRRFDDIDQRNL